MAYTEEGRAQARADHLKIDNRLCIDKVEAVVGCDGDRIAQLGQVHDANGRLLSQLRQNNALVGLLVDQLRQGLAQMADLMPAGVYRLDRADYGRGGTAA